MSFVFFSLCTHIGRSTGSINLSQLQLMLRIVYNVPLDLRTNTVFHTAQLTIFNIPIKTMFVRHSTLGVIYFRFLTHSRNMLSHQSMHSQAPSLNPLLLCLLRLLLLPSPLKTPHNSTDYLPHNPEYMTKTKTPNPNPHGISKKVHQRPVTIAETQEDPKIFPLLLGSMMRERMQSTPELYWQNPQLLLASGLVR